MIQRMQIQIQGTVQGVGFRPFVYNLAIQHALTGHVSNNTRGVQIELEGEAGAMERFLSALQRQPPPLACIESIESRPNLSPIGYEQFAILESTTLEEKLVRISPDVGICADCLAEIFDASNRRYRYPFTNCTNCGPRFTIVQDVPYDRKMTTMKDFDMCKDCDREYHDPTNRRFHAQPNACPKCGPRITFSDSSGIIAHEDAALQLAIQKILHGKIVAIKGIGGYHLCCDSLNDQAVSILRNRKVREDKPFALMALSVNNIREFCDVDDAEEDLLTSDRRPIVLLRKKSDCSIPESVAPKLNYLAFMLPYSPLHYLLLLDFDRPLVMTSGNTSDEPIAYQDDDAFERLSHIADCFLSHNREIHVRCDDSVTRITLEAPCIIRRSRGYAPDPITLPFEFEHPLLACGAELKNTFCLAKQNYAFVSHHIGDLENVETLKSFEDGITHFKKLFNIEPEAVAYDLHPEYLSTKYALDLATPLKIGVQHHHAHIASCMADNAIIGDVIGVAMDGLGYGLDGNFWGCEFMIANLQDFQRVSHLQYLPMRGGAKAIKEPWRMAATYLNHTYGSGFSGIDLDFNHRMDLKAWKVLEKVKSPLTSSMGRCFDAISSLLGIRDRTQYEGEAAIELEMLAQDDIFEAYEFGLSDDGTAIEVAPVIISVVSDIQAKVPAPVIAARFHNAVADLIVGIAIKIRKMSKLNRVALSGGVFQNSLLLNKTITKLKYELFDVYSHHRVPSNDGGISLGQAVIANARMSQGLCG